MASCEQGEEGERELQLCPLPGKKPGGSVSAPALLLRGFGGWKGETEHDQGAGLGMAGAGRVCQAVSI